MNGGRYGKFGHHHPPPHHFHHHGSPQHHHYNFGDNEYFDFDDMEEMKIEGKFNDKKYVDRFLLNRKNFDNLLEKVGNNIHNNFENRRHGQPLNNNDMKDLPSFEESDDIFYMERGRGRGGPRGGGHGPGGPRGRGGHHGPPGGPGFDGPGPHGGRGHPPEFDGPHRGFRGRGEFNSRGNSRENSRPNSKIGKKKSLNMPISRNDSKNYDIESQQSIISKQEGMDDEFEDNYIQKDFDEINYNDINNKNKKQVLKSTVHTNKDNTTNNYNLYERGGYGTYKANNEAELENYFNNVRNNNINNNNNNNYNINYDDEDMIEIDSNNNKQNNNNENEKLSKSKIKKLTKEAAKNWQKISEKYIKASGLYILKTIGTVIKALTFMQKVEEGKDDEYSMDEQVRMYETLASNRDIITMLSQAHQESIRRQKEMEKLNNDNDNDNNEKILEEKEKKRLEV